MNKIYLIGRSCKDCEVLKAGDKEYTRINLAVNRKFDKEKTDFFNCTAWGKLATDVVAKYVKKGTKVAVVGRIEFNEDKDGKRHHGVIIEDVELLSKAEQADVRKLEEVQASDENLPF